MKIAVHLARHRRLAAWVGFSLLLHLLAFALLDGLVSSPPPAIGTPIALRLVHGETPPKEAVAGTQPPVPQESEAEAKPESAQPPVTLPAMRPLLPATNADATPSAAAAATPGTAPLQMPGRYRVRPPPSATLDYAVTRTAPGAMTVAGETAQLDWSLANGAYHLRLDGVLGRFESEGGEDDAGLAPAEGKETTAAGGTRATRFNREERRIEHGPFAASGPLYLGSQDRASVLMQLAAIGLAEPEQMQDTIDIVVAGGGGARIVRWQVLGQEELATGAGVLTTVRLAQLAPAGEARVEVWLAPGRHWLPVQLRVTRPDGTVENQLLTRIEM